MESDIDPFDIPIYNEYFTVVVDPELPSSEGDKQLQSGKTTENECHHHTYEVDPKGNGYTSYAYHPKSDKVRHRHQIINYVVQSAASECYPNCEIEYGVKGAPHHVHILRSDQQEQVDQEVMSMTNQMTFTEQTLQTTNMSSMTTSLMSSNQGSY